MEATDHLVGSYKHDPGHSLVRYDNVRVPAAAMLGEEGHGFQFVTLGYAAGSIPAIPLNLVLLKGITVKGMEIRTFMMDYHDEFDRDNAELKTLFAEGKLRPYIGARFPLSEAAAALRYFADRKAVGKVVIEVA